MSRCINGFAALHRWLTRKGRAKTSVAIVRAGVDRRLRSRKESPGFQGRVYPGPGCAGSQESCQHTNATGALRSSSSSSFFSSSPPSNRYPLNNSLSFACPFRRFLHRVRRTCLMTIRYVACISNFPSDPSGPGKILKRESNCCCYSRRSKSLGSPAYLCRPRSYISNVNVVHLYDVKF